MKTSMVRLRVPLLFGVIMLSNGIINAQTPTVLSICDLAAEAQTSNGKEFTVRAIYAQTFHGALVTDESCRSTKANVTFTSGYKASAASLKMLKKIAREGNEALITFHGVFRAAHKEQCFGQNCEPFQVEVDEIIAVVRPNPKVGAGLGHEASGHAQRAIDAFGKQNVDNGVTVMAGKAGSDSLTLVANTAGPQTADNPNGQKITVTFGTDKLNGAEGNGLDIGHEGSHVADGTAWVNSGFSPSMNPTRYGTEFRAFQVQRNLAEGINWGPRGFVERSGPVYIWKPGWTGSQVDAGINNELRQHYNLSPSSKILAFKQNTQGGH